MMTMLATIGLHAAAKKRRRELSSALASAGGAVEEDLQEEDPRQQRADLVELLGVDAPARIERVEAEDQRRGDERRRP